MQQRVDKVSIRERGWNLERGYYKFEKMCLSIEQETYRNIRASLSKRSNKAE